MFKKDGLTSFSSYHQLWIFQSTADYFLLNIDFKVITVEVNDTTEVEISKLCRVNDIRFQLPVIDVSYYYYVFYSLHLD